MPASSSPASETPEEARRARAGPDLAHLEEALGDVLLEERIARTSRSAVYRVRAGGREDRELALKVALQAGDAEDQARFLHEVRLLSEVSHPHVVEIFDWGVLPGGFPFLTMELLETGGLGERLRRAGWDAFYEAALQVTAGLAHIHRHGVLHLDLKPANLGLVPDAGSPRADGPDRELRLKILDFGLARSLGDPLGRDIRGTLAYTAPEILLREGYDPRADLYSLGLTLLELATGVLPSAGDTAATVRFQLEGEVVEPLKLRPDMPEPLARILRRLLARDPGRRQASAGEVVEALARAAGRDVVPGEAALGGGRLLSSRMVGRDDALERLRSELDRAREGHGSTLLVEGEEGMGKSRLLREFRLFAALAGARVGRSRPPVGRAEPVRPLREAVASLGLEAEAADEEVEEGPWGRDSYRASRQILARLAMAPGNAPWVLLLDDLHLADRETREILAFLAPDLARLPVLLVAARRPPAAGDRDRLGGTDGVTRLPLLPLDEESILTLARACLGTAELPPALEEWLLEHGGGAPREIQELLRHLIEEGLLRRQGKLWRVSPADLPHPAGGPEGLRDLGWQRVVRLEGLPRTALEAAAVVGEPFPLGDLAQLLEEPPEAVYDALDTLASRGYLDRRSEDGGVLYGFSQRRLQEVLYAGLEAGRRRRLHLRLAQILARRSRQRVPPSAVAEHLWRAGERVEARPWLLKAAGRASDVHAHGEAAELYARAGEAARQAGDLEASLQAMAREARALASAGRYPRALKAYQDLLGHPEAAGREMDDRLFAARMWLEKGQLHGRVGEHGEALESYRSGLGRLEELEDRGQGGDGGAREVERLRIELLHGQATALRDRGRPEDAFEMARGALRRAGREGLDRLRASLLSTLANLFYAKNDQRRAERLLRRALWVAESTDDQRLAARLRNNLGNVLWRTGAYEAAEGIYRENLALCEEAHDLWGQLTALNNLGILLASRGRWREAREPLEQSLSMKRRLGAWETEALARLNLGEAEEVLGDWLAALEHYRRGLELLRDQGDHPDRLALLAQMASLERKRGNAEEARWRAEEALDGARRIEDGDLAGRCERLLGLLARDRGRHDEACAYLDRAVASVRAADTPELLGRCLVARARLELGREEGSVARARHWLAEARSILEDLDDRLAEGELLEAEAALAAREGRQGEALAAYGAAVERFEDLGTPFELARSLYEWGLHSAEPEAASRLRRALELFRDLGAEAEARRSRGALELLATSGRSGVRVQQEGKLPPASQGATGQGGGGPAGVPAAVLYEVMKVINSTLDLDEVLDRILDLVLGRLHAERGLIVLSDPLTRELTPAASRNLRQEGEERSLSESVVRRVIEEGVPVITVDALSDQRFSTAESVIVSQIRSILCVPLEIRDRLAGAIYVDHCNSRALFGEVERDFLVAFADQAAIAIENARLYGDLEEARERLKAENESLRREMLETHHLGSFIGKSPAIRELKSVLERVARSGATVLIRGESGTGKGLVGRIIHGISPRREGPFVHFNCAALPESLAESELFGHEKGAFTGAAGRKPGRFELAEGGTIFLDEIGKISEAMQAKLLRVVEEKQFERVGGTETLEADVRIIAATNLELEEAIHRGEFREDLYYRLNIVPLVLPPLRERREDIPYLAQHFLKKISQDLGRPGKQLDPAVLDLFHAHAWPGNVRELEATIHRALVLTGDDVLKPEHFSWLGLGEGKVAREGPGAGEEGGEAPGVPEVLSEGGYKEALDAYDRRLLEAALERCGGRIRETSRVLGISRNTLKAKMERYGMR